MLCNLSVPQVKPLLSVDSDEARHRVLSLYKAWYRHLPWMLHEFTLPVTLEACKKTLRRKFEEQRHVKDIRVIDMLVIKASSVSMDIKF